MKKTFLEKLQQDDSSTFFCKDNEIVIVYNRKDEEVYILDDANATSATVMGINDLTTALDQFKNSSRYSKVHAIVSALKNKF